MSELLKNAMTCWVVGCMQRTRANSTPCYEPFSALFTGFKRTVSGQIDHLG
jgi:hypothetical protein